MKIGVLVADGFQDSEYFLPKFEIEKMDIQTEVISIECKPVEIYSFFTRIGMLDVNKSIQEANPADYIGVLVPGGAKSPVILSDSEAVLAFLRQMNTERKLVAPICRGTLLVARSGVVKNRRVTGFHLKDRFPDLVIQPSVEQLGGIWSDDQPVVVDNNLISSRNPDDLLHFTGAIQKWLNTAQTQSQPA